MLHHIGIVVGILGLENSTGEFQAIDVCYPQLAPQPALRGVPEEGTQIVLCETDERTQSLKFPCVPSR